VRRRVVRFGEIRIEVERLLGGELRALDRDRIA